MISHISGCRRLVDPFGQPWHSAVCESLLANHLYALRQSGGDQRYANAITHWLFGKELR